MSLLHELIAAQLVGGGGGGGGSITVDTALSSTSTNPVQNKVVNAAFMQAADMLDEKEPKPIVENVSDTAATILPDDHYFYQCGTLTSLTIENQPSAKEWSIRFTSGSTATTLTMPSSVKMPDGFEVEANTVYEINVLDWYALCAGWPVS
jgi:hypothetical protein